MIVTVLEWSRPDKGNGHGHGNGNGTVKNEWSNWSLNFTIFYSRYLIEFYYLSEVEMKKGVSFFYILKNLSHSAMVVDSYTKKIEF